MVNPYFIETKSVQPALAGLGNTLAQFGQVQKKKALERDMSHLQQAFQVGDLEKIAELSAKNPALRQEAVQNFEFSNKQSEQAANVAASRIMATQDPVMALDALSQGVDDVVGKVGKARMMRRDLARLQEAIDSGDPAKAQQVLRNIQATAAFLMPNAVKKSYQFGSTQTVDLGKDKGGLHFAIPRMNPNTGEIETKLTPVDGELTDKLGLTAKGKVTQAAEKATAVEQAKAEVQSETQPRIVEMVEKAKIKAKSLAETGDELAKLEANMPVLKEVANELLSLSEKVTHTMSGRAFDFAAKELGFGGTEGATARAKYISVINNQVLPLLKATFGSAFTEKEGAQLKATLGDVNATPEEKRAQLEAFIEAKEREVRAKRGALGLEEKEEAPQVQGEVKFLGFE